MVQITISIDVSNIKKAEEFYIKALGCEKVKDQGNMSIISAENVKIYLQEKEEGSNPIPSKEVTRTYQRHWTPIHLDFLCDNVSEVVSKILEFGGTQEGGEKGEWGEIVFCADPFGNGFCVINE